MTKIHLQPQRTQGDWQFERDRSAIIAYLMLKVRLQDWRGVSNAANDLMELETQRGNK